VQPVVRGVDRDPVAAADDAQQPQHEVHGAAADQERARTAPRAREREAGEAVEHVDDVVQHADLEDPEQLRRRAVAGEREVAVVGRDPRDEPEHADGQEHDGDEHGQ
jgi:hypothetical protein